MAERKIFSGEGMYMLVLAVVAVAVVLVGSEVVWVTERNGRRGQDDDTDDYYTSIKIARNYTDCLMPHSLSHYSTVPH